MPSLKAIKKQADGMLDRYAGLKEAQAEYERMSRLQYTLPDPLDKFDWVRPIISDAPYLALKGTTRTLSNLQEDLHIHPITVHKVTKSDDESKASRTKANQWEKNLQWQMGKTSKRKASFRSSVIWNAALYDEVVGQLMHLPTQFKTTDIGEAREAAALQYGDWAVRLLDAQSVYVDYSDYMPERVLVAQLKTAQQIVDFWGESAKEIQKKIDDDEEGKYAQKLLLELDFVDYEARAVWVVDKDSDITDKGITLMEPAPWLTIIDENGKDTGDPVPFLPFIAVAGGTDTDSDPKYQRKPLLFPVYMAEQWATSNIMGTIEFSRVIATAAAPDMVITGPGAEDVDVVYGEPASKIILNQFQTFELLRKQGLESGIIEAFDRVENAIKRSTISDILVTGQPTIGAGPVSFSAYNLQVQVAVASIGGIKELGERWYEGLYTTLLLITHYTGGEITGYGNDVEKFTIDSEDIDIHSIHLSVELKTDVPVDRQQRINSAVTIAQHMKYPFQRIAKMIGETDPEGAWRDYMREQIDLAVLGGRLQLVEAEATGALGQMQQQLEQMAQMLEQVQKQIQQAPQQAPQQGSQENVQQGAASELGGLQNAANFGGQPPIQSDQTTTREQQTGAANDGVPLAEGF